MGLTNTAFMAFTIFASAAAATFTARWHRKQQRSRPLPKRTASHEMAARLPQHLAAASRAELGDGGALPLIPLADLPAGLIHRLASRLRHGSHDGSNGEAVGFCERGWQRILEDSGQPAELSSSGAVQLGTPGSALEGRQWGLESHSLQLEAGRMKVSEIWIPLPQGQFLGLPYCA